MATYPDDATAPVTAFSVVAESQFDNTGASRTDFNLPSTVEHKGEITPLLMVYYNKQLRMIYQFRPNSSVFNTPTQQSYN